MDYLSFQTVKSLAFCALTSDEIKSLSVLEITNTEILDDLGNPTEGGLHDLHLGPNEQDELCATCHLNVFKCPGHPGHITLPLPVYNPLFFQQLYEILRGSCMTCHRILASESELCLVYYQLKALDYGLVSTVQELAKVINEDVVKGTDHSEYLFTVKCKLKNKFKEAIQGLTTDDMKNSVYTSVIECRRQLLKNFLKKIMKVGSGKCLYCQTPYKKFKKIGTKIVCTEKKKGRRSASSSENESEISNEEIFPENVREHLHLLWENYKFILRNLFKILQKDNESEISVDIFFMDLIMVPPTKFRKLNFVNGKKHPDCQTEMLNDILKVCHDIKVMLKITKDTPIHENEKDIFRKVRGKTRNEKLNILHQMLQRYVNKLFDSDTTKTNPELSKGIKQLLEKKKGLFRYNMMGKRVNYSARSVISPDPYICVNEIGIPMFFAKKLTYPEPVSQLNYEKLKNAVKNGPNIYPGATLVEYENGKIVKLTSTDPARRQAIANKLLTPQVSMDKNPGKVKIVHRHLRDGDMLLLNRQPTLHKPSIMAHKAKVLPGENSIKLHYVTCKQYNADFDGDEMNAHLPQFYSGQSECHHIASVNHQYLVPKDGTPLSGLIQDHVVAGVLLTMRGSFFPKDQYHQLLYSALSFLPKRLKLLPPSIIKPIKLWSGKQIISSIIINLIPEQKLLHFEGKAKIPAKSWKNSPSRPWKAGGTPFNRHSMCESEVFIRGGELLCGIFDKAQIGPSAYSVIHLCYELFGGEVSSEMLTSFSRLFTHFLQYYSGFSLGIRDIIISKKANDQRKKILEKANTEGLIASAKALDIENLKEPDEEEILKKYKDAHHCKDDFQLKILDNEMKNATTKLNKAINDVCMPNGFIKTFPKNNLQLMIESGAKGSLANAMEISVNVGQIDLEGQRPRPMLNGSTLPCFKPYDTSPAAGGFVSGCFLTGVNSKEYFFHCMAGREGLIDTAVKTSSSGYIQRCLIKHFEGLTVNYDLTVRNSDGTIIQFLYGEDGLDVSKSQLLKEKSLSLLAQNFKAAANEEHINILQRKVAVDLKKSKEQVIRWKKEHPNPLCRTPLIKSLPNTRSNMSVKQRIKKLNALKMEIDESILKEFNEATQKCPDPVNAYHRPDLVFGSVSEKLDEILLDYVNKNLGYSCAVSSADHLSSKNFLNICYYRALKSLAEPGEPVGLLAAQSIGEPSTQMTLNTFHFAGKGEMNVTLGIPRIREILKDASTKIATPTMDLPLLDKPGIMEEAEKLMLQLNPVSLKQVLDSIKIEEFLSVHSDPPSNFRNYVIRMNFLKYSQYKDQLYTTPKKVLCYVEKIFIKKLSETIEKKKHLTMSSKLVDTRKESVNFIKFNEIEEDAKDEGDGLLHQDNEGNSFIENYDDEDTISSELEISRNQEQDYGDIEEEDIFPEESEDENQMEEELTKQKKISYKSRLSKEFLVSENSVVKRIDYDFDLENGRWFEMSLQLELDAGIIDMKTLLEEEVSKAVVHAVPGIKQALLVKNPDAKNGCNMMLKTNGVNFLEIFKHVDILDINKVYSNDIHAVSKIYGIEAAAKVIKKEIVNVFKPYGISVDYRHLSLISDYMTSSGFYKPCNRQGMKGSSSPLQQISFETSEKFLVDAMIMGTEDQLKGPSASIILGQLCSAGTGSFDVFTTVH